MRHAAPRATRVNEKVAAIYFRDTPATFVLRCVCTLHNRRWRAAADKPTQTNSRTG
jgi:hypothetical protein